MRHQYIGVKHKIQSNDHGFNWNDGVIHWENFLNYKRVFGDVKIHPKPKLNDGNCYFSVCLVSDMCVSVVFGVGVCVS